VPDVVTFLLTDVEGSTRLWETRPDAMRRINERHDALVDEVVGGAGTVFRDRAEGDSSFAAFDDAAQAVAAAVAMQRAIEAEPWPEGLAVRVRAALHAGPAEQRDGQYYGPVVNRGVRLRALAHGGQVVVSEAVKSAADALPEEIVLRDLGTHRLKDLAAPEHVYQVCGPGLTEQFPPLRSVDVVRNNLTVATTAFVGRVDEQKALVDLLRTHRLVTITGSGGVGKTRIAREVAAALVDRFTDGVWFVDFTAARNAGDLGRATADAVGAKDDPVRTPAEVVGDQLRATKTLLVLDNCEHLAGAAGALVTQILAAAPDVRVLITSRQPVGVAGERVWRVPPLASDTAVELFVDRVRLAEPYRDFDEGERAAVERLCEQLDGIPLAIELTAARVKEMPSIGALADALTDRLAVSEGDDATGAGRQRTMRATIEWSHDLLTAEERRLLRRLAVFLGGFTLEAAEGVCADERLDVFDVFDVLGQLVAQSLVQADDDGSEFRYRLLEVVREFAGERLGNSPEWGSLHSSHQAWFVQFAERHGGQLYFGDIPSALDALEQELPNLRRAIDWDGTSPEEDARYRLVVALYRFWVLRGHARGGLDAAETVLATPVVRRGWRASTLVLAATLSEQLAEVDNAVESYRAAAALFSEIDADIDEWGADLDDATREAHHKNFAGQQAWCVIRQAVLSAMRGRPTEQLAQQALASARAAGGHTLALVLADAGELALASGDVATAEARFSESLDLLVATDDIIEATRARVRLGALDWARGRFSSARRVFADAREASEAANDPTGVANAVKNLAEVSVALGDAERLDEARDAWRQFEALGDRRAVADSLVLRVRAGDRDEVGNALELARSLGDAAALSTALAAAIQAVPDSRAAEQWSADLVALASSAPAWLRPTALAANAFTSRDPADVCASVAELRRAPLAMGVLELLAFADDVLTAAVDPLGTALRSGLAGARAALLAELGRCEDEGVEPDLTPWIDRIEAATPSLGR